MSAVAAVLARLLQQDVEHALAGRLVAVCRRPRAEPVGCDGAQAAGAARVPALFLDSDDVGARGQKWLWQKKLDETKETKK